MNIASTFLSWVKSKRWGEYNPIYWPIASWTITLGGIGIVDVVINAVERVENLYLALPLALILVVAAIAPLLGILGFAKSYPHNEKALRRIIFLYIALIFICANINFVLLFLFDSGSPPFHGIHPVWEFSHGRDLYWKNLLLSVVDCIHFSFVTLATLGYGDMYPTKWFSKLAVDVELLVGLGITVLTVGRFFSGKNT